MYEKCQVFNDSMEAKVAALTRETNSEIKVRMTLWDLPQNAKALVSGFAQEISDKYRLRLDDLGFASGEEVTCLKTIPFNGPRVYKIGDSVFSVDREIASQILVSNEQIK